MPALPYRQLPGSLLSHLKPLSMQTQRATEQTSRLATAPQDLIRSFRAAYTFEQVQEALWGCLQPCLLASFNERNPAATNKLAAFYENLEVLLSAVYQLPDLPPPTQEQEPTLTLFFAGDQPHV